MRQNASLFLLLSDTTQRCIRFLILILCLLILHNHGDKTKYRTDRKGGVEEHGLVCLLAEHRDAEKVGCTDHAAKGGDEDVEELEEVDEYNARKDCTYDGDNPVEDVGLEKFYLGELICDKYECKGTAVKATRGTDKEYRKLVKCPSKNPSEKSTYHADDDREVNTLGQGVCHFLKDKGGKEKVAEVTAGERCRDGKLKSQDAVAVKCGKHKSKAVNDEEKEISVHLLKHLGIGFCKCVGIKG